MSAVLKNLCRTCMSTHANINVESSPNNGPTIMELLHSVQPQKPVQIQDMLPKLMCLGCVEQLQNTYEFLEMCKDTVQKYRKLLLQEDDDDQILEYPKDNGRNKEHIDDSGYESQIAKFEIEIFENEPNSQQPEFETTFAYNNRIGDELNFFDKAFVGNYGDEHVNQRLKRKILEKSHPKEEIPGPVFLGEGCDKVIQKRTSKKHELPNALKLKRMKNLCKGKRNDVKTPRLIWPENCFQSSTADPIYEQNSASSSPREIGPTCLSPSCFKSRLRNCEKFKEDIRNNIFQNFWNLTWEAKRFFVRDHVILVAKKRKPVVNSRKQNTFVFKLPCDHDSLQVCRTMFLSTLNISKNLFRAWMIDDKPIPAQRYTSKYKIAKI